MSRFLSEKYTSLEAYTPGEQPKDTKYIKLNTNESPFDPPAEVTAAAAEAAKNLRLYPDPTCSSIIRKLAEVCGLSEDEIMINNGSDEGLYFTFLAYCDKEHPVVFPDITYGFYKVFAELVGADYEEIPLKDDFTVDVNDYTGINKNIFLANPNALTGISLPGSEIERIVSSNPENVILIDEAYVDFGGESSLPLIKKYDNVIVTQTFSKSRSLAGARLGFTCASPALIQDLNTIRNSTNPYNVNRVTLAAGEASLGVQDQTLANCRKIIENRDYTVAGLKELGFTMTDSSANFIFASSPDISGEKLYLELKKRGILVRHFSGERVKEYIRVTIGTRSEMESFLRETKDILNK